MPPQTHAPEVALFPLRTLSWGVILLTAYMGLIAWAGLQATFFPAPPSPPVYLVDMPAPLLVVNALIIVMPLAMLLFIGLGLQGLRLNVPDAKRGLTWQVGSRILAPGRVIALLIAAAVLSFLVEAGVVALAVLFGAPTSGVFLMVGATFESILVALGWCLMVFPAKTIGPWTTPKETMVVKAAIWLISGAALFAIAAQFIAAAFEAAGGQTSAGSSLSSPSWVQGVSGLVAFAGLFVVAWINRRIVHRLKRETVKAAPSPAQAE